MFTFNILNLNLNKFNINKIKLIEQLCIYKSVFIAELYIYLRWIGEWNT